MSTNTNDRAEARRRARLAARGELPPEEPADIEQETAQGGGFLGRIFPAAPPLPGRPDPLAGFDTTGPMRPVRERLFLLRQAPLVWILGGFVAFLGDIALRYWGTQIFGLIGTVAQFGALIAAGWFGWRRPTLYGTAAGLVGFALSTIFILWVFAALGAPPETFGTPVDLAGRLVVQGAWWAGLGFLGGWYGGYLRRRQAQLSAQAGRRR
jgi:hypothetical protein